MLLARAGRKPGSVPALPPVVVIPLGRPLPDGSCDLLEIEIQRGPRWRGCPRDPGLVLLRVGFAEPPPSPEGRCALTAPFHPCRTLARPAVYFLLHCPSSHLDWPLASTLPYEARTFLDGNLAAPPRPSVRLQREDSAYSTGPGSTRYSPERRSSSDLPSR